MTEGQLQAEVIKQARSLGWGTTLGARRTMLEEAAAYRVEAPPIDGLIYHPRYSLGSEPGWPDLVLARRIDRRLIFAELKTEKGVLSARQAEVLELLRAVAWPRCTCHGPIAGHFGTQELDGVTHDSGCALVGGGFSRLGPRVEVFVWRPSDLTAGRIAEVLR